MPPGFKLFSTANRCFVTGAYSLPEHAWHFVTSQVWTMSEHIMPKQLVKKHDHASAQGTDNGRGPGQGSANKAPTVESDVR
jgi:hypothetical protein